MNSTSRPGCERAPVSETATAEHEERADVATVASVVAGTVGIVAYRR